MSILRIGLLPAAVVVIASAPAKAATLDRPSLPGAIGAYGGYTAWAVADATGVTRLMVHRGGGTKRIDIDPSATELDLTLGPDAFGMPTVAFSKCPAAGPGGRFQRSGVALDATGAGVTPPARGCGIWLVDARSGASRRLAIPLTANQSAVRPSIRGRRMAFALADYRAGSTPRWSVALFDTISGQTSIIKRLRTGRCDTVRGLPSCGPGPAQLALTSSRVFVHEHVRVGAGRYAARLLSIALRSKRRRVLARLRASVGESSPRLVGPAVDGARVHWIRTGRRGGLFSASTRTGRSLRRRSAPRYTAGVTLTPTGSPSTATP